MTDQTAPETETKPKYWPCGAEDEASACKALRERFQQGQDADRENRDAALDDLKFLAGEQWDSTVEAARLAAGRPCLTVNRLPQFVAQVIGDIRINRPGIKVRPAEDGDETVAEVRQGLIRSIEQQSRAQQVYALAGQSQVACGIGHFRLNLEYAADDVFDRDLRVKLIQNPFAVVWDPMRVEPTGRDAGWCFVVDEMDRKAFEKAYKDAMPSGLTVEQCEQGWVNRDTVRLTEYWQVKQTPAEIALVQRPPEAQPHIVYSEEIQPGDAVLKTRKTVRTSVCMWMTNGHNVLDGPYEWPIDRVPIFRVPGWEIAVGDRVTRFGLVRFAKDPQRLMNYSRSVLAETVALQPKVRWLVHENAEGDADDFREAHDNGDAVLTWTGTTPPQQVPPPMFPAALANESALYAQDMKDVTGLHDASLGAQSNETSGRAILARDRQGDVATFVYPDNLKDAIAECGRVINQLIPVVYDTARTVKVLGEDDSVKPQRINDPLHPESVDIGVGKYDVVVETGPSYSTKRVEAAESMTEFVRAVPMAGQVAGDLIAKAQDWPDAEAIAERLKRALPAQITQDPEQPQQPDPAAQAAQMAQMQGVKLDLDLKQAQVAKAQADAGMAQFQLSNMNGSLQQLVAAHVAQLLGGSFEPGAPAPDQLATGGQPGLTG